MRTNCFIVMDLHYIVCTGVISAKYLELSFASFIRISSITGLVHSTFLEQPFFAFFNIIFILLSGFGIVVNLLITVLFAVDFRSY